MENPGLDIFAELRERLFRISQSRFRIWSSIQYSSLIDDIIGRYFPLRLSIPQETIPSLLETILDVKSKISDRLINVELDIKEDNIFIEPYEPIDVKHKRALEESARLLQSELDFYDSELTKLLNETNRLASLDIQTEKGRLKFNMPVAEIAALFRILKDVDIINSNSNKELCHFIAQNFSSIGKTEDISFPRLEKLMSPDLEILKSVESKLVEVQKQIARLKRKKS